MVSVDNGDYLNLLFWGLEIRFKPAKLEKINIKNAKKWNKRKGVTTSNVTIISKEPLIKKALAFKDFSRNLNSSNNPAVF